jgi:flagellar motility protein MotE (MotC chaperone)
MTRSILMVCGILCVVTLMSETLGLGLLWWQGRLNGETISQIRDVLLGNEDEEPSGVQETPNRLPSNDEVIRERALRILDLQRREAELDQLKRLVDGKGNEILAHLDQLEKEKKEFEEELQTQTEQVTSEAAEQSRGILTALPSGEAVRNLMQLPLEENVVLLKGLPEKTIAKILQEFTGSLDEETQTRGLEIFEAITHGDPTNRLVRDTQQQLAAGAAGPAS